MAQAGDSYASSGYFNVMEGLVSQEVWRQIKNMPSWFRKSRRWSEVMPYALNRLPTLYASSQQGFQHQVRYAQQQLQATISQVVKDALLVTRPDPLEHRGQLKVEHLKDSEVVLQALGQVFGEPNLDWETALTKLQTLKQDTATFTELCAASAPTWTAANPYLSTQWSRRHPEVEDAERSPTAPLNSSGWENQMYRH
ncbi:late competence development ComFB family protein [Leptolyngbya iicbica]|uniref:Uncharacterized protein n=2 Tax=Cyanophyceae TaxID=3028117 RepID=A0A4Q7E5E8_9CYAN|nr:late competence development ComFB family protein [Leptolyngbya sp. LK]RZM77304.1 hypothetical protein DYY88_16825 [Leptolyngbya sp. LK]